MTTAKVRVAFIDHCAQLSGAEMALLRLVPALREVDPLVVLAEDGPLRSRLEAAGAAVVVLPLPSRTASLRRDRVGRGLPLSTLVDVVAYVWRLRALLRARDIDVVHTNSLKACFYGGLAGRLARRPVVWHARDRYHRDYLPRAAVSLVRFAARLLATTVIANSHTTMSTLAPHPRRQQRVVIPDPLDAPIYGVGRRRLAAQSRGDRTLAPTVVGLIGRISPWKGQDVFVRAMAQLANDAAPVRARLVGTAMFGEHDYSDSVHRLGEELGVAELLDWRGFREDVATELAELDVLVHCSTIPEPFGQVVIEGMAAALPVVSTDVGGPAEVIEDGRTGVLVRPGDPVALAAVLRRLVADPVERERLGRAAHDSAADYRDDIVGAPFDAIFRRLGDRRPRPKHRSLTIVRINR